MIFQSAQLDLKRCPHCGVDTPNLYKVQEFDTQDHEKSNFRTWAMYTCKRCGGVVTTSAQQTDMHREINEIYPLPLAVHESIPEKANSYLNQAINTINSPSGSVMLSASAIDAMLKEFGYLNGNLFARIKKAAEDHIITESMSEWAHEVRSVANDERHADASSDLPTEIDARKSVDFALALAEFLFVLPSKVEKGLADAKNN